MENVWESWCSLCGSAGETKEIKANPDILFFLSHFFKVIFYFQNQKKSLDVFCFSARFLN
jgi:hypothetical protein